MTFPYARRALAAAVFALACASASTPSLAAEPAKAAHVDDALQHSLEALAQRARPATLGIAVLDLSTGASPRVNAEVAFPMMSVFKAPVAAAVLSRVDEGTLSLQQLVSITRDQVQSGSAIPSVGTHFKGERMDFTLEQLLKAAVSESDNTAVNALLRTVGGPDVVTEYFRAHGIEGMRVDMDEAGISRIFNGLPPGGQAPENESDAAAAKRYEHGYQAFLKDPRNRTTPDAAITFLHKLVEGSLLSPASTQRLLALMKAQTIPNRLRAGLPPGVRFADKTGTSGSLGNRTAAFNDMGIITWPDGHKVLVAAFLMDSATTAKERDQLFAEIARTVATAAHP
ncbi:beta-lactamase class A [Dyella jiangningensis]|uniref:class A beta-lactamase n=1 Tax=Dyella sp. AtDHG13 TaxID=1938897 RepID=UPI000885BC28|nr:class A beta-lactamase [Dyella sp. AtDHG13]PXV61568.1 beta-lactamase class A [Dyella sp. AtDHG13]SDJ71188.1 beta-lactamase class A [Dyella jiangningensis]